MLISYSSSISLAGEVDDYAFAYKLYQEEVYSMSKDEFRKFIENYPKSESVDDARYLMGECAFNEGKYSEAIEHYKRLVNDYPNSLLRLDAVRGVANAWYGLGKYEEAIRGYNEVVQKSNPKKDAEIISSSLYKMGEGYYNLGRYREARSKFDQLLKNYPEAAEYKLALYSKGWGLYRLKKYDTAYKTFSQLIKQYPDEPETPEAAYRAAECLLGLEDWQKAARKYKDVIEKYGNDEQHQKLGLSAKRIEIIVADAKYRLGECYFQQNKLEDALREFEKLLQDYKKPEVAARAQFWIGEVLLAGKKYPQAVHELQKVINLYPNSDMVDDARYSIATAYFEQKDYPKAIKEYKVVANDRKSEYKDAARYKTGECLRIQREYNTAILHYSKVSQRSEYIDDVYYGKGFCYFHLHDYANASKSYETLLTSHPKSSLRKYALYQLAVTYFENKQYQEASDKFDTFLRENPNSTEAGARADEALFWYARSRYELRDYKDAMQLCQRLISNFPNSDMKYKAEFFLAESIYWDGGYAESRAKYEQLLRKHPKGEKALEAHYGIGWSYFSQASDTKNKRTQAKLYRNAIAAWEKVILSPNNPLSDKARYQIGIAYLNLKEYEKAIASFKTIPKNSDWKDNARYRIAWTLYKKEDYRKAIDAFKEMLAKHPATMLAPNAVFGIGNCYFKLEKYPNAIRYYTQLIEKWPNTQMPVEEPGEEKIVDLRAEAQYRIADSYYNQKQYTQAIKHYEKLVQIYPKSDWTDDARYGIGLAYQQLKQDEKAMAAFNELIKKHPGSDLAPDVQLVLGNFYYEVKKNYSRAIAEYKKVVDRYEKSAPQTAWQAQYAIGLSYHKLKSYDNAISAFEKVDPRSDVAPKAAWHKGWCWQDKDRPNGRNLQRAIAAYERAITQFPSSPEAKRAMLSIGECHEELAEWQQAAAVYRRLIKGFPKSREAKRAQLLLGHAYHNAKQYNDAVVAYQKITGDKIDQYSNEIKYEAWASLGESLYNLKKYDRAAKAYLRVALYHNVDPFNALVAHNKAGLCYENLKSWYDALTWYKKALKYSEKYSDHPKKTAQWEQLLNRTRNRIKFVEGQINKEMGQ